MITLLVGENSFAIERALAGLRDAFDGTPERLDGSVLEARDLADIFMATTLFSPRRLVVIKGLSENTAVWNASLDWLDRLNDDTHIVLVEPKPDKRTKTFKQLQKVADIKEFPLWDPRDETKATEWVMDEANTLKINLGRAEARLLVDRVGVDQWLLFDALLKLRYETNVTQNRIEQLIDATPSENVFLLFESALKGEAERVHVMLQTLRITEDPYRLFGLMGSQAFQLAVLSVADVSDAEVAKSIGASPFVLRKLSPLARRLGAERVKSITQSLAEADTAMKTSAIDPWLAIEKALQEIARL